MNANNNQLLSALIDGELSDKELEEVLDLLANDETLKIQFSAYQRISDVLNGHSDEALHYNLVENINQSLAIATINTQVTKDQSDEGQNDSTAPLASEKNKVFKASLWKQTSGLAIAASFGALAVVLTNTQTIPTSFPNAEIAYTTDDTGPRWTVNEPVLADRLNSYLLEHNAYAGASDIFANARVIAYDVNQ